MIHSSEEEVMKLRTESLQWIADRLFWACLADWRSPVRIVKPDTVPAEPTSEKESSQDTYFKNRYFAHIIKEMAKNPEHRDLFPGAPQARLRAATHATFGLLNSTPHSASQHGAS